MQPNSTTAATKHAVSFDVSPEDSALIQDIAYRAMGHPILRGKVKLIDLLMDLTACHANGNALRLEELLATDDANFMHDVVGIINHIDRRNGELRHCFSPRFGKPIGGAR